MSLVDAFVEQYRGVHRAVLSTIQDLSPEALNWIPCPGANSIAILMTHLVGSELETVRTVAGVRTQRDREAEFAVADARTSQLVELVEDADTVLGDLAAQIGQAELEALRVRPSALDRTSRSGTYLLLNSLAHAREHLGQIFLTKQLYGASVGEESSQS